MELVLKFLKDPGHLLTELGKPLEILRLSGKFSRRMPQFELHQHQFRQQLGVQCRGHSGQALFQGPFAALDPILSELVDQLVNKFPGVTQHTPFRTSHRSFRQLTSTRVY